MNRRICLHNDTANRYPYERGLLLDKTFYGDRKRYAGFLVIQLLIWSALITTYGTVCYYCVGQYLIKFPSCIIFLGIWWILFDFLWIIKRHRKILSAVISDRYILIRTAYMDYKFGWDEVVCAKKSHLLCLNGYLALDIHQKNYPKQLSFVGLSDKDLYEVIGLINGSVTFV